MRIIVLFAAMITTVTVLYKWRYRLMNTLLAISFLRRIAVSLSLNMPVLRSKVLPGLFNNQSTNP